MTIAALAVGFLSTPRLLPIAPHPPDPTFLLERLAPFLFVFLWSTGWISARGAAPHADPLTFLAVRYGSAFLAILPFAFVMGSRWPTSPRAILHIAVCALLLHAVYLGGVWWAVAHGVPAGVSALIAALQPLLTAALAWPLVAERVSPKQWLGIAIGFGGMVLVIAPRLAALESGALVGALVPLGINVVAMVAVTLGTFYQKRFMASGDLVPITALQYAFAFAMTLPVAAATESMRLDWTWELVVVLAWSVLALSVGGIALLFVMIRRGAVSRIATLIYLVPPTAAIEAWFLFGETLTPIQILGMVVTVLGVALAGRG